MFTNARVFVSIMIEHGLCSNVRVIVILILALGLHNSSCQQIHVSWLVIIQVVITCCWLFENTRMWCSDMMSDLSKTLSALHMVTSPFLCPFILKLIIMSVEITIVVVLKQLAHPLWVFPFNLEFKAVSVIIFVF